MPRITLNNRISLLQNGEAYFPAIEAALDIAVHEIYLESYIFEDGLIRIMIGMVGYAPGNWSGATGAIATSLFGE